MIKTAIDDPAVPPTDAALSDAAAAGYENYSDKVWVDPASLPRAGDASAIAGNAPDYVKQLTLNTFAWYGVGDEDRFGHSAGKAVKFTYVNIDGNDGTHGRMQTTTIAEVVVERSMVNGAGMMHGGCLAYLIDNCCSTALVVLGLSMKKNGVGVTQALNIIYHSPAPVGSILQFVSTSVAFGGRSMTARCEVKDKAAGRVVASAILNKMQPAKL